MTKANKKRILGRRSFLKLAGVGAAGAAFPHIWIPKPAIAQTVGRDSAKHLIYIRLSGGFRFPTAFNGDVADEFNPWGLARNVPSGVDWGVGRLLEEGGDWLESEENAEVGLRAVPELATDISVVPCVDHEPLNGSADGNHQTGLERFLTGYVGGETGIFTMINYGLRERVLTAAADGITLLPAVIMGEAGIGRGSGPYAAYRPPVMRGDDLDRFGQSVDEVLPAWARSMSEEYDERFLVRQNFQHQPTVDAYLQSRAATKAYAEIFASEDLKIQNGSNEAFDGISNAQLEAIFGDSGAARNIRTALRLFHYGCPAVYLDQGGYDYHSDEEENLPGRLAEANRLISGLHQALHQMEHPDGGSYWDHTIVAFGSEFSRTTRGGRFNSARGSDHSGDLATRWMSMPFMGGPIAGGRMIGETRSSDLEAQGKVFSYRATMLTLMDALGVDHQEFFNTSEDEPYDDLFG